MILNNINNDFDLIVASALRVALIEDTDLSLTVQKFIVDNIQVLSDKIKEVFIRDIKERENDKIYGNMLNKERWLDLAEILQKNISDNLKNGIKQYKDIEIVNINNGFEIIVEASVKYGLGRKTYITSVIPEFIIENLNVLSDDVKTKIIEDITVQKDYGDNCDKASWMNLLEELEKTIC